MLLPATTQLEHFDLHGSYGHLYVQACDPAIEPLFEAKSNTDVFRLLAKRLERGRFIWPSPADGCVAISGAQLAYMLDGIDWRNPQRTFRPELAG